jgi:hypothetical protein
VVVNQIYKILKLHLLKKVNVKSPFWVTEVYGLGRCLKAYAFYPEKFPLFCYMDHGVTLFDSIPSHEKENDCTSYF